MSVGPPDRLVAALADRYRLERELGEGGMATVYLAEDLKHKRKVALKVLKPELAAVLGAERFVQEITTTAALQHPHILPLYDSGEADGFLFYVMPFIDGETLRSKLDREKELGVDDAVRLTREVADALHYAHAQGVVHRDIKPENILLSNGRAHVMDFGIARAVHEESARLTATGLAVGTPQYMSPEQASGERDVGPASDVYSLASVAFEMLTGEAPYTGASARAIMTKGITDPVPSARRLRSAISPSIDAAVMRALSPVPADRPASAGAFANALTAPAPSHARRRWALGGVAAAVVVALTVFAWQGRSRAEPAIPNADLDRARTLLARRTPDATRDALGIFQRALADNPGSVEALAGVSYTHTLFVDWGWDLDGLTPAELRARALDYSQRALAADSTSAQAWMSRAYILVMNDPYRFRGAVPAFERSLAIDSTSSEGWYQFGQALMQLGEDSAAAHAYRRAFALDPGRPMALMSLAGIALKSRRFPEAKVLIDSAVAASPTVTSPYVRVVRGRIALMQGDLRVARDEAELALAMDTTYTIPARSLLAMLAWAEGNRTSAHRELGHMKAEGGTGNLSPTTARYLASALVAMGRLDEAVDVIERARPRGAQLWFYLQSPDFAPLGSNARFQGIVRDTDPRAR